MNTFDPRKFLNGIKIKENTKTSIGVGAKGKGRPNH